MAEGTLRHDNDDGPAFGMVAHRQGQADLGLPHAFGAALAASVKEQDDGPLLVVVATPVLGQVDLKPIGHAVEHELAVEETRLLLRVGVGTARGAGHCGK